MHVCVCYQEHIKPWASCPASCAPGVTFWPKHTRSEYNNAATTALSDLAKSSATITVLQGVLKTGSFEGHSSSGQHILQED